VIKVNKNDIDLCNYNLPERDEFVTKVIRVMIKFNTDVVTRPIVVFHEIRAVNCWHHLLFQFSNFEFPNLAIYRGKLINSNY
jgi:hypothetical protein